ncbi:MAG: hypothetical protein WCP28_22220, partial [Actinomycetes bacterium]
MAYPYLANPPPPDPDTVRQLREQADAARAASAARKAAERPARVTALGLGPPLRDIEAAADCPCGCHPRPTGGLHTGGATCPCQRTDAERHAVVRAPADNSQMKGMFARMARQEQDDFDAAQAAAVALGTTCTRYEGLFPLVITGVALGRAFYLRCRHEGWTLELAGADRPLDDPYTHDDPQALVIAGGTEGDLCTADSRRIDPDTAMAVIVT